MENSRSCFEGNSRISSQNTSLNFTRMGNSSMWHCSLSTSMSQIFTANNLQPFIMLFFACKVDICLTKNFFGTPWVLTQLPWLSVHKIYLCKQSSMTWCCSNQSMSISISYDPKGRMFRFTFVGKPFRFTSQYLTISKMFHFIPMANCTSQGLSCFCLPILHT